MSNFARLTQYLLRHPFIRFALVGVGGYVVDTGVLAWDTAILGLDFKTGRAISMFVAMAFTWLGNRYLTFRDRRARSLAGALQEWLKFIGANAVGAVVNYGLSVFLVAYAAEPFSHKFVAQASGILAGLFFNFTLSKNLVFKGPL